MKAFRNFRRCWKGMCFIAIYFVPLILLACLICTGCSKIACKHFQNTLDPVNGTIRLPVLSTPVTVGRDAMGIPYIEAKNMEDLACAMGYVNASDRLTQMVGVKLLSQGRLAEMVGPAVIDLDVYIRTIGVPRVAEKLLKNLSPEKRRLLDRYCDGVNAYMEQHGDRLPPGIALSGYRPDKWNPIDSISIFEFVNLALSFNLHEEIGILSLAQRVGIENSAWLLPIYPDEPIAFDEAAKRKGIDLKKVAEATSGMSRLQSLLAALKLDGIAASNNWVISRERTARGASIFANDTHLYLTMPSMWDMMHVKCGTYDAAGIGIAGLPLIVAGYNRHIAWGMTMVMADNQDIFLEKLRDTDGVLQYLYKGQWLPVSRRSETISIKGGKPRVINILGTCHGPLLNDAINRDSLSFIQSPTVDLPYGIALSWAADNEDDRTLDAFLDLNFAKSVDEAMPIIKQVRAFALNIVFADKDNIAWQVTGNYPIRAKGRGLMPSPGWTGEYDWKGYMDKAALPWAKNPSGGFIGTANNRTIPKDYPDILSSSWFWPERSERISQMAGSTRAHTLQTSMDMQLDTNSLLVPKLQRVLLQGSLYEGIKQEINGWKDESAKKKANLAMEMLSRFDGRMTADSSNACIVGALLNSATRNIFLDELGPEDSRTWRTFIAVNNLNYNATVDHILVRGDESPFWDDIRTPEKETKAQIMARSFRDAYEMLESMLGKDQAHWRWGDLHTYMWDVEATKLAPHMGVIDRFALWSLGTYFNRGPYPAPGDFATLNVSAYHMGKDFNTWLIPAMRIIVDFGVDEPMVAMNNSGQSDNPSSVHYDDAIPAWLNGKYNPMPFEEAAVKNQYRDVLILTP